MATLFKSAIVESKVTATVELGGNNVSGRRARILGLNEVIKLCSGSEPDGAYVFTKDVTLTGGQDIIDTYDSLVDIEVNTITMTGQKMRVVKFKAPSTNIGTVQLINHPTNGYLIFSPLFYSNLSPGQSILIFLNDDAPVVSATSCNIQALGTLNDKLEYIMIFG
jgi:hypothetical protein